ncbi:MAG TPA: GYD domain-containing protein [Acidimicrobiia bacterium]|nr:GYD domain-containing protein [Acidimicrobiia bacterium]
MAKYIILGNYTAQGMAAIKESPARLDAAREGLASMGVTIEDFYLTFGEYDIVTVADAPDAATAAKAVMTLGMAGNVSTVTMAALSESEFRKVVSELP